MQQLFLEKFAPETGSSEVERRSVFHCTLLCYDHLPLVLQKILTKKITE